VKGGGGPTILRKRKRKGASSYLRGEKKTFPSSAEKEGGGENSFGRGEEKLTCKEKGERPIPTLTEGGKKGKRERGKKTPHITPTPTWGGGKKKRFLEKKGYLSSLTVEGKRKGEGGTIIVKEKKEGEKL